MSSSPLLRRAGSLPGNWFLAISLLLALGLSMIGITWGRYEDWNFDQMAFLGLRPNGIPYHYLKPPLTTYLTEFLVIDPIRFLAAHFPLNTSDPNHSLAITMVCGHLLTILLYCGSIALVFGSIRKGCGVKSAAAISLVMATSAGLIQFNHYGTSDSPLLFWMLASFAMSMRLARTGRMIDAVLAGLLAGLAAADKYNGLGVAIAIPAALFMQSGWRSLYRMPLILGSLSVPLGFLIGNPGAILDHQRFVQQFLYNLYTTPVYYGDTHRLGYLDFLGSFPELIGLPASLLLLGLALGSLALLCRRSLQRSELILMIVCGSVFAFYFATIGRFPRMEPRFVLPAVPFAMILAAPALQRIALSRWPATATLGALLIYNIFCSLLLGYRFLGDPRMDAQIYAMAHFSRGALVESTYTPNWNLLPGVTVRERKVSCDSGFDNRFTKIFGKENKVIEQGLKDCAAHDPKDFFTAEELRLRNPDYITFTSVTYVIAGTPETRRFYQDLEEGKLGYAKVFDKSYPRIPSWIYPHSSDALMERIVILKKNS